MGGLVSGGRSACCLEPEECRRVAGKKVFRYGAPLCTLVAQAVIAPLNSDRIMAVTQATLHESPARATNIQDPQPSAAVEQVQLAVEKSVFTVILCRAVRHQVVRRVKSDRLFGFQN